MPDEIVSHYKLIGKLGGGGMGIVYRAQDLRLGREVALKFLPEHVVPDAPALDRFQREARAASALSHPNICTIFDIDEHQGRPFIAMELLDGATLKHRIGAGPLALSQLLDWAAQICAGLHAAHARGIVHRDIKPANIFVTAGGQVKILDFGLAKVVGPRHSTAALGNGETETLTEEFHTSPGTAVGTIAYMSPEQARGEEVDTRTDLFSFGVVLYEMAAGRAPFRGNTSAVIFEAILNRQPEPVSTANPAIPPELERIVLKALEKDRRLRYQTAADLAADLHRLNRDTGFIQAAPAPSSRRRSALIAGVSVAAVLMAAAAIWKLRSTTTPPEPTPVRVTSNSSEAAVMSVALSPDGKTLAYSDRNGIHLRFIQTGETHLLPQTAGYFATTWFPDGTRLAAVTSAAGGVNGAFSVSNLGGPVRKLSDVANGYPMVSPDGSQIAFQGKQGEEIWMIGPNGENPRLLRSMPAGYIAAYLAWSPDGRRLAWLQRRKGGGNPAIQSMVITGGEPSIAIPSDGVPGPALALTWVKDGRLLVVCWEPAPRSRDMNFWQARVDPRTGRADGPLRRVTNWRGFSLLSDLTVSADGKRLAFQRYLSQTDVSVAAIEAGGPRIGPLRRLTLDDSNDSPSGWTPDSRAVLFSSDRNGVSAIFKQSLDADSAAELVIGGPEPVTVARLSADQQWILYLVRPRPVGGKPQPTRLMRLPVAGGAPELIFESPNLVPVGSRCAKAPATLCACIEQAGNERVIFQLDPLQGKGRELFRIPAAQADADISPDAKRFAYLVPGGKSNRIRFVNASGQLEREVEVEGWTGVNAMDWSADGAGLFVGAFTPAKGATLLYVDLAGKATSLWNQPGSFRTWGIPSPDGRYLAILTGTTDSNAWIIENF